MKFSLQHNKEKEQYILSLEFNPKKIYDEEAYDEIKSTEGLTPPTRYVGLGKKVAYIEYNLTGLKSLARVTESMINTEDIVIIMYNFLTTYKKYLKLDNFTSDYVYWNLDYIFVDGSNNVLFTVFPVEGLPVVSSIPNLILTFCSHLKLSSDKAIKLVEQISEFCENDFSFKLLDSYIKDKYVNLQLAQRSFTPINKGANLDLDGMSNFNSMFLGDNQQLDDVPEVEQIDDYEDVPSIEEVSTLEDEDTISPIENDEPSLVEEDLVEEELEEEKVQEPVNAIKKPLSLGALGDETSILIPKSDLGSITPTDSLRVALKQLSNGDIIELPEGTLIIGKGMEADYRLLDNKAISRKHIEVISNSQGVFIADLGSANGTFINNVKKAKDIKQQINVDDVVMLANEKFKVVEI